MDEEEEDDLYKIENYSDNDLFRMLNLTNPTDRELEAKIEMEIEKYDNMDGPNAKQLKDFFEKVHKHFFILNWCSCWPSQTLSKPFLDLYFKQCRSFYICHLI